MHRLSFRKIPDLVAAACARGDDGRVRISGAHRGHESILGDGEADLVVIDLVAEVADHAAAAAVDDLNIVARGRQHIDRHLVAGQRLVVTVAVEQSLARVRPPESLEAISRVGLGHKLLNREGLPGHDLGPLGVAGQGQIFVAHGQDAAGLNTNDGHALLGIGRKQCHVVIGPGLGLVGLAAGDERTPATLARSGDEDPVIHSSRRHDERPAC